MNRIISFMHISLDGFVAGAQGEMNWIRIDQEIFDHVGERIRQTHTALYGRKTYEMMESYWPTAADKADASKHDIEHSRWYKHASKIVLSRTMQDLGSPGMRVINGNIADQIHQIRNSGEGTEEILLFGSPSATHALMELDLIDGYWLFLNPIILGSGIPLFTDVSQQRDLQLVGTKQFASGVVELSYIK